MNTTNKGKLSKAQLLDFFEEAGYSANDLKTALKTASYTAKMLTELHAAWTRVELHPAVGDFQAASWSEIRSTFETHFEHVLPKEAPESRFHLNQLWLECMWENRDTVTMVQEEVPNNYSGDENGTVSELEQQEEIRLLTEEAAAAKAASTKEAQAQRAQKDKDFAAHREKLREEIASYKRPRQGGSNSWSNVQTNSLIGK